MRTGDKRSWERALVNGASSAEGTDAYRTVQPPLGTHNSIPETRPPWPPANPAYRQTPGRARCVETRPADSASGLRKRADGNIGNRAPGRLNQTSKTVAIELSTDA